MEKKRKIPKEVTTPQENREYLRSIFGMFRDVQVVINAQQHPKYNNTEIRMMNEIVYATGDGERLISTQLADRLGITSSAVSQIVGKLEKDGALRRVPDDVDKKIAYVELTDEMAAKYKAIVDHYTAFVGKVIAYMGVHKMDKLIALVDEFRTSVENACLDCECEQKSAKN
jgi:DNA-binding MarR family transcriptional regulator